MVVAHWYRPSGWLERLRLVRGRFKGKGAVGGMSPFPVADSPETIPPGPGSNTCQYKSPLASSVKVRRGDRPRSWGFCQHQRQKSTENVTPAQAGVQNN